MLGNGVQWGKATFKAQSSFWLGSSVKENKILYENEKILYENSFDNIKLYLYTSNSWYCFHPILSISILVRTDM